MPFPESRDLKLILEAASLAKEAEQLSDWVGRFAKMRTKGVKPISADGQFELLKLRRKSRAILASARVPVAAGVYGMSQVGKSLLMGRVLAAEQAGQSTLGRDGIVVGDGPERVSFHEDLNPRTVDFEATALVTRLTTKDRMPTGGAASSLPVMVRALTRAQWLSVLGRGFQMECAEPTGTWTESAIEKCFIELAKDFGAAQVDPAWRSDLLDTYSYLREEKPRLYDAKDEQFFGLLSRYPLNEQGCIRLAAHLFWDNWDKLTGLFDRVWQFLRVLETQGGKRDESVDCSYVHLDWRAVRFLLDSQRNPSYSTHNFGEVCWSDFRLCIGNKSVELRKSATGDSVELGVIQAAMLEMIVPVLPDMLTESWRRVLQGMDLLDLPGCLPGKTSDGGKRQASEALGENDLQQIVKRGKVAYLFEGYSRDKQIQTLLVLVRGGNISDGGTLKNHIGRWGRARYEELWHERIPAGKRPSLFIGLTGFDQPFRNLSHFVESSLFDARFSALSNAINPIMDEFGGKDVPFRNTYLVRYPGSWDADTEGRSRDGAEKWERAYTAFLQSTKVQQYMEDPETKVARAKLDHDGGLSLISEHFLEVTDSDAKQDQLQQEIRQAQLRLRQLAESWYVPKDIGAKRKERRELADKVLRWLDSPEAMFRVHAIIDSLSLRDGEVTVLADLADPTSPHDIVQDADLEERVLASLQDVLNQWSLESAPKRWSEHLAAQARMYPKHHEGRYAPGQFTAADFGHLVAYLKDYLTSPSLQECLLEVLLPIVNLQLGADRNVLQQNARRRFTRMLLNDFLLNPGPNRSELEFAGRELASATGGAADFIQRWQRRLPAALGGGGRDDDLPPGNDELAPLVKQ